MFITKKHMSRRTVLRERRRDACPAPSGCDGASRDGLAQTAATPKPRFVGCFVPHGAAPGYWVPDKVGALEPQLPFNWKPLEPFRNETVILSGMWSKSAEPPPGATGADHWVAAAFLCADKPKKTTGADVYDGTTIDQIIAKKIGRENLLPSMQFAVEDPGANSSNCGEGYSCTYTNTISWSSPTQPLPMELNPQVVFERMFGDGSTPEQRARRRKRDGSILDSLTGSLSRLRNEAGASDRARLDDYTDERPRDRAPAANCHEGFDRRADDMSGAGGRAANFRRTHQTAVRSAGAGLPGGHHPRGHAAVCARPHRPHLSRKRSAHPRLSMAGSHHGEDPKKIAELSKINQYHVKMLAHLVANLAKTPDGDGTLLDHSLVLYGSNMGNSNQHVHYDVPHVLVGGLNGKLKGGRHLALSDQNGSDRQSAY